MRNILFAFFIIFALNPHCPADQNATEELRQVMELLPGYQVRLRPGIDSIGGDLWKDRGLTIHFDLSGNAGNYADSEDVKKQTLWRREQTVNGRKLICVYTKSRDFYATFPPSTNFFATIRNQEDLADMLLMVLTFHQSSPAAKETAAPR